jgi:hypothetical protein
MIGFKITATCKERGYNKVESGWSEGYPVIEGKVKDAIVEKLVVQGGKLIVKGTVGAGVSVAEFLLSQAWGVGSGIGNFMAQNLIKINDTRFQRAASLHQGYNVKVKITGDFQAEYAIRGYRDIEKLPYLLAMIPQKNTKPYQFMGNHVLKAAHELHLHFLDNRVVLSSNLQQHRAEQMKAQGVSFQGPCTLNLNIAV